MLAIVGPGDVPDLAVGADRGAPVTATIDQTIAREAKRLLSFKGRRYSRSSGEDRALWKCP